ncbi:aspartate/glutamate racemase family protein [uncultured Anaerotruncus sp.]|uniref:aspartate/glutamate racemase family protein n=1 Tax=uncultured Anaerotruncus sp. TaxID=905011 RepID=UPI00280A873E|nr:aspartate/glutamate racemase family protein [uncultured Anaerotruncus sp.]
MEKSAAIIQTSAVSSAELAQLCAELLPGVRIHQIIDDSLIREVNANCGPTPGVRRRMYAYYQSAQSLGVDAILNQCSSVGEVADQIAPFVDVPVVRIDEAMAREAVRLGKKIGLVATVESTVGPSGRLIERAAREAGKEIRLSRRLVQGAMMELIEHKNVEKHNAMVLGEVEAAARENDVVVLAQGSMTVLLPLLGHIQKPVLTSPRLGVESLRAVLGRGD